MPVLSTWLAGLRASPLPLLARGAERLVRDHSGRGCPAYRSVPGCAEVHPVPVCRRELIGPRFRSLVRAVVYPDRRSARSSRSLKGGDPAEPPWFRRRSTPSAPQGGQTNSLACWRGKSVCRTWAASMRVPIFGLRPEGACRGKPPVSASVHQGDGHCEAHPCVRRRGSTERRALTKPWCALAAWEGRGAKLAHLSRRAFLP